MQWEYKIKNYIRFSHLVQQSVLPQSEHHHVSPVPGSKWGEKVLQIKHNWVWLAQQCNHTDWKYKGHFWEARFKPLYTGIILISSDIFWQWCWALTSANDSPVSQFRAGTCPHCWYSRSNDQSFFQPDFVIICKMTRFETSSQLYLHQFTRLSFISLYLLPSRCLCRPGWHWEWGGQSSLSSSSRCPLAAPLATHTQAHNYHTHTHCSSNSDPTLPI